MTTTTRDERRWRAVCARSLLPDDAFCFAVRTTGIYCRANCASRAPKRENVRFFDSNAAARAAGYRPCKRCKPDQIDAQSPHSILVAKACATLAAAADRLSLKTLAETVGASPFHLQRVFKATLGVSPREYQSQLRAGRVQESLGSAASVTDAVYDAGFASSSRFYAQVDDTIGMAPTRFRAGGAGESIQFAVARCSVGYVLVARTPRGICTVDLGDSAAALSERLRTRFPAAQLRPGDEAFGALLREVVARIDGKTHARTAALSLDVRGTAFQQRVWQALRAIPRGETASYSELAARIGSPKATRAVAQACAQNQVAVLIPCHRVVRSDGSLSGYRWGPERKATLLAQERALTTRKAKRIGDGSP